MTKQKAIAIEHVKLGGLPLVHDIADKLEVRRLLEEAVPQDAREKIPAAETLYTILCNVICERFPLYKMGEWARSRDLLMADLAQAMNDDRVGRALHRLFHADRAALVTQLALQATRRFHIATDRLHNDSTSIKLFGQYDRPHKAAKPKRGHSKDHRPDLRQLLFSLTVSGDGAIPLYFKVWDGNVTDDTTHLRNWMALRGLTGRADFTYVADCKLCTRENMEFIASEGGYFVTVMPETRAEAKRFKDLLQSHAPAWLEVMRKPGKCRDNPPAVYWTVESPFLSAEGFRIIWVKSSDKRRLDEEKRSAAIDQTAAALREIQGATWRSREKLEAAVTSALKKHGAEKYFSWQIGVERNDTFKQVGRGRPNPATKYQKVEKTFYTLSWAPQDDRIRYEAACDGIFPLITNRKEPSKEILEVYKFQPRLEKRHEQLKSVYDVAPVFLKHPERIEALLLLYFMGLMIMSLIERTIRQEMKRRGIVSIPIYPEQRACRAPTADKVLDLFSDVRRQTVLEGDRILSVVHDALTPIQQQVLELLAIKEEDFFCSRRH